MSRHIESFQQKFGELWPIHTQAFGEMLIQARRGFGGDLDSLLILTVIGGRTLSRETIHGIDYDGFMAGTPGPDCRQRFTNIQSISDVTGIPRETVRRKTRKMIDRGWIENSAEGLRASRAAAEDLEAVTEATFRYLSVILDHLFPDAAKPSR